LGFSINESTFQVVGFFFLFLLSSLVLTAGNLEYSTGTDEFYVYGNNFDGYHWDGYNTSAPSQIDREAFLFHVETTKTYANADSPTVIRFGVWLSIISALGIALSLADIKAWVQRRRASED